MEKNRKPVVLAIVDGWGVSQDSQNNAITQAKTPHIDRFIKQYPVMNLYASGPDVGLAFDMEGNVETGHVNIGAGRVWHTTQSYIDARIADKTFFDNRVLVEACEYTREHNSTLHIVGLLSTADTHARIEHCYALLDMAKKHKVKDVAVHVILDGVDAPHDAGKALVADLLVYMSEIQVGRIASISGRFFAMDRDHYWNRTEQAYRAIVDGTSEYRVSNILEYIQDAYDQGIADADIVPAVIGDGHVRDHDSIVFFNTSADRMRQLVESVALPAFTHFDRAYRSNTFVVTMRDYEAEIPVRIAFPGRIAHNSLADVLSKAGKTQYHIADTERYPHVTYFFNGYISDIHDGETQKIIPSPHVASYTEKPSIVAETITKEVIKAVESGQYDFIVCNFSNIDVLAHTGNIEATKKGVRAIDKALGAITEYVLAAEGTLCVTSSHGSGEYIVKNKKNQHNLNLVPCILVSEKLFGTVGKAGDPPNDDMSLLAPAGRLADIAPTILKLLDIEQPDEMSGESLI